MQECVVSLELGSKFYKFGKTKTDRNVFVQKLVYDHEDCILSESFLYSPNCNLSSLDAGRTETGGVPVPHR